jgi:glutaminyl-tRNA synthetase
MPESNRKVKGTIHWVTRKHAVEAEVRLYDRLFNVENPGDEKDKDFRELLNPDSLKVIKAYVEPCPKDVKPLQNYQFQRIGYFNVDPDSTADSLVFNRTVGLKDSWTKKNN